MAKIKAFHGYEVDELTERVNKWIVDNQVEVISTNTSICGFGVDGQYTNIVITILYVEANTLTKSKVKKYDSSYYLAQKEYMK